MKYAGSVQGPPDLSSRRGYSRVVGTKIVGLKIVELKIIELKIIEQQAELKLSKKILTWGDAASR